MKNPGYWEPCLADCHRGTSFFDGITIEADSITEPRWDRVLPILEEEQVFMCRMMAPLLQSRPAPLVLDVGTGSGVFAIQAAKLGCRVVAIDISPRALRFTRHNAKINKIPIVDAEPRAGEIQLKNCSLQSLREASRYDIVILAPPYNPTCPGFRPALHAEAGPLGQDAFLEQVPLAARLLRADGVCVGNQMIPVTPDGTFTELHVLSEAFPGGKFRFVRILPDDIRVEDFLKAQYSSYLKPELGLKPSSEEVKQYIAKISDSLNFSLIYYEIHSHQVIETHPKAVKISEEKIPISARPSRTWTDRYELHRHIIEHTASEHSFPAPALFLDIDALPDFPNSDIKSENDSPEWNKSVLRYVDSWLAKTNILDTKRGLFDLILVDTAPWYPTSEGRRNFQQESAVWVTQSWPRDIAKNFLAHYQDNTVRLQETRIGPFLHPQFTGRKAPNEWREVQFTTQDLGGSKSRACDQRETLVAKLITDLDSRKTLGPSEFEDNIETPVSIAVRQSAAFVHAPTEKLNVPASDLAKYEEEVSYRAQELLSGLSKTSQCELLTDDLELCHMAMHRRIDTLAPKNGAFPSGPSSLIGIPVSLASPQTELLQTGLPDNYRGGIWLYAIARSAWCPESEHYLLDLSRLLRLLYEAKYSVLAANELRRIGREEKASAIYHHIPQDLASLDWSLSNLRKAIEKHNCDPIGLLNLFPETGTMAFLIMTANAAARRSSYKLLPSDLCSRFTQEISFDLVNEIYQRLAIPYLEQRILDSDVIKSDQFCVSQIQLLHEDFLTLFPRPRIAPLPSFQLPSGSDAYIWMILALRGAAFHSYKPIISDAEATQGIITIEYVEADQFILISNSGNAPLQHIEQKGWKDDIEVFKRPLQSWYVVEQEPGIFSSWNPEMERWETKIKYRELSLN